MAVIKKYTLKNRLADAENELKAIFPGWSCYYYFNQTPEDARGAVKINVYSKYHGKQKFATLYIPNWNKESGKKRKFVLVDLENNLAVKRINMNFIVDHFIGDGSSCVNWNKNNVDLMRFHDEMEEIGYKFVITH